MTEPHPIMVTLLQGRPTVPDAPEQPSEAAQRFEDWLASDTAPTPPAGLVRAEARAMSRYLAALATDVQALAAELHAGSQRSLESSDLPTVAHAEYAAGFRAGAYSVASDVAKKLTAALERAQREARAC